MKTTFQSVDDYIGSFPEDIQSLLRRLRKIILEKAPDATESISYGMPAYKTYSRPLVYFAAYKAHIGLYATPTGHKKFARELSEYRRGKGSVQFPLEAPLPWELIGRIVDFRVRENKDMTKRRQPL